MAGIDVLVCDATQNSFLIYDEFISENIVLCILYSTTRRKTCKFSVTPTNHPPPRPPTIVSHTQNWNNSAAQQNLINLNIFAAYKQVPHDLNKLKVLGHILGVVAAARGIGKFLAFKYSEVHIIYT